MFCCLHRCGAGARAPLQLAPLRPGALLPPSVTVEAEGASTGRCPPRKPGAFGMQEPLGSQSGSSVCMRFHGTAQEGPCQMGCDEPQPGQGVLRVVARTRCHSTGSRAPSAADRRTALRLFLWAAGRPVSLPVCCPLPRGHFRSLSVTQSLPAVQSPVVPLHPRSHVITRGHGCHSHGKPSPFPAPCALGVGGGGGHTQARENPTS